MCDISAYITAYSLLILISWIANISFTMNINNIRANVNIISLVANIRTNVTTNISANISAYNMFQYRGNKQFRPFFKPEIDPTGHKNNLFKFLLTRPSGPGQS